MIQSREVSFHHRLLIDLCLLNNVPFYWSGPGLLLISRRGIGQVLEELSRRRIPVLGLDGFEFDGKELTSRMDLIFDSEISPSTLTPTKLVSTWPEGIWVDVTLGGTHEGASVLH
jgi:hypothetical protein